VATVSKTVRFFRPVLIESDESRTDLDGTFWPSLRAHVAGLDTTARRVTVGGVRYRGDAGVGKVRSLPYLRVGSMRPPADWPDTVDDVDEVEHLQLTGRVLLENAYLVPFGTTSQVALMNPITGLVPMSAIETWIATVLDLQTQGQSIEFVPEVDTQVLAKLNRSIAVASVKVKIPYDDDLDMPDGSASRVESALSDLEDAAGPELDIEIKLSHGRRTPQQMGLTLKNFAQRLSRATGPERIDVSMVLPSGDGFKRETHNLLRDEIAVTAKFTRPDDQQLSVDEILDAMGEAIGQFRQRG
jgi:hypothetical protein